MGELECENIFGGDALNKCALLTSHMECFTTYDYVYAKLHFCWLNENIYLSIPILMLILCIFFYLLSTTAERYLSPALANISTALSLSQNVGGLTLLALGNGAPDTISSLVACHGSSPNGLFLGVGAIIGSSIVTSTFTTAMVIFTSNKPITMGEREFRQNTIIYIISLGLLIIFLCTGSVTIYTPILFMALYVSYVIFAILMEKLGESERPKYSGGLLPEGRLRLEFEMKDLHSLARIVMQIEEEEEYMEYIQEGNGEVMDGVENVEGGDYNMNIKGDINGGENSITRGDVEDVGNVSMRNMRDRGSTRRNHNSRLYAFYRMKEILSSVGQTNWSDIQGGKLIYLYFIVTTGFAFLRRITMPPVKESAWSANWAAFSLVGANVFILTVFNLWSIQIDGINIWIIMLIEGIILALFVKFKIKNVPSKLILSLFSVIAFGISIIWMFVAVANIVAMIKLLQLLTNIKCFYLGVIILGIGNSIPDIFANIALTKLGYPKMAITGCISGPLFITSIGLGLSFLLTILQGGSIHFSLQSLDTYLAIFAILCLVAYKLFTLAVASKTNYCMTKSLGIMLFTFYVIFALLVTLIAFWFQLLYISFVHWILGQIIFH